MTQKPPAARARTLGTGGVAPVAGRSNAEVAAADVVIVAVPFAGQAATLSPLAAEPAGTVVVDCVVPMCFEDEQGADVLDVPEGQHDGAGGRVAPRQSGRGRRPRETDTVQALAGRLPGMRGAYAGRLRNARQVEARTINLVSVNRRYRIHTGIRITDV